jgi:hypothetical protein
MVKVGYLHTPNIVVPAARVPLVRAGMPAMFRGRISDRAILMCSLSAGSLSSGSATVMWPTATSRHRLGLHPRRHGVPLDAGTSA